MNNTNTIPSTAGLSTLERAKFGPGMLLQHEDLEMLNTYTRELNRLMFKSLFGCGVVCGLKVEVDTNCGLTVVVGAGLALSCCGDPIYVPKGDKVDINPDCAPDVTGPFWVMLCPTVKCCAPRPSACPSDDDETTSECTRERDGYLIKVMSGTDRPKCACGCDRDDPAWNTTADSTCRCVNPELECYAAHYAGECGCDCDDCSDCKCECILLARLEKGANEWEVDYRVRRFVRPVLMRDPFVTPKGNVEMKTQSMKSEVDRAAINAARGAIIEAAEKAALAEAKKIVGEIAPIGQNAVKELMKEINPKDLAEKAMKEAMAQPENAVAGAAAPPYAEAVAEVAAEQPAEQKAGGKNKAADKKIEPK